MPTKSNNKGVMPPADVQAAVKRLIAEKGEDGAAKHLEFSRNTVIRLLAGRPVNRATLRAIRSQLGLEASS